MSHRNQCFDDHLRAQGGLLGLVAKSCTVWAESVVERKGCTTSAEVTGRTTTDNALIWHWQRGPPVPVLNFNQICTNTPGAVQLPSMYMLSQHFILHTIVQQRQMICFWQSLTWIGPPEVILCKTERQRELLHHVLSHTAFWLTRVTAGLCYMHMILLRSIQSQEEQSRNFLIIPRTIWIAMLVVEIFKTSVIFREIKIHCFLLGSARWCSG